MVSQRSVPTQVQRLSSVVGLVPPPSSATTLLLLLLLLPGCTTAALVATLHPHKKGGEEVHASERPEWNVWHFVLGGGGDATTQCSAAVDAAALHDCSSSTTRAYTLEEGVFHILPVCQN